MCKIGNEIRLIVATYHFNMCLFQVPCNFEVIMLVADRWLQTTQFKETIDQMGSIFSTA